MDAIIIKNKEDVNDNTSDNTSDIKIENTITCNEDYENRFDVIKKIGSGSFSNVYKVLDKDSNEETVLKIFKYKKYSKVYEDEIRFLNKLKNHMNEHNFMTYTKHVCRKIGDFSFSDEYFINYKLYGENLYYVLSKYYTSGFPIQKLNKYKDDIILGLDYIHSAGIIHRDLKPENIVFTNRRDYMSDLVIIDFGLSYDNDSNMKDEFTYYLQSRYYRAPETIFEINKSFSIDIWSLGCILFELFFGQVLFPGKNEDQMIKYFNTTIGKPPKYYYNSKVYKQKYHKNFRNLIDIYDTNGYVYEENNNLINEIFNKFIYNKRKNIFEYNKTLNQIDNDTIENNLNNLENNDSNTEKNSPSLQPKKKFKKDLSVDDILKFNNYRNLIQDCIVWNPRERFSIKQLYVKYVN